MPIYTDKKSGALFIKFDLKGVAYKKRLPRETTVEQADVQEKEWKARLSENGSLEPVESRQMLFETFLVHYYLPYAEGKKKSFERDVEICKISLQDYKGRNLRSIKPLDIEMWIAKRKNTPAQHGTPRKPATVMRELSVLSSFFTLALKGEFVDYNPCHRAEKLSFDNTGTAKLNDGDEEKFFAAFESDWGRDIAELIFHTGLRQTDALGLKWSEVNWDEMLICLIQDKTGRRVEIPINDSAKAILEKWSQKRSCEYVFPSPKTGTRGTSVKKAIAGAVKRSGIKRVTVRDLRRTTASRLLEEDVNHLTIASYLGHTDTRVIHRYAQSIKKKREAAKLLDKQQNRAKIVPEP